jgi:glycolate oxidase FAD binding subunit
MAGAVRGRGSAGTGVIYVAIPTAAPDRFSAFLDHLRNVCAGLGGSVVMLDGPPEVKAAVDSWGPVSALELMRRVKHEFDPHRRLSPGRFVGGI